MVLDDLRPARAVRHDPRRKLGGIYWVSLRIVSLALTTVGLLAWLLLALRWPRLRPRTAIWPAIALPPITLGLSALVSPYQRLGLEYVAWAILLTALYLLLVRILAWPHARARIGALAAILGLALGVAYLGSVMVLWVEWWSLLGAFVAPPMRPLFVGFSWGNPSAVMTIQVLLLLIATAGLGTGSRRSRVTLAVLAAMTLLVIIISGSRAGWLAIAGAVVVTGGIWVAPDIWRRAKSLRTGLTQRPVGSPHRDRAGDLRDPRDHFSSRGSGLASRPEGTAAG